MKPRTKIKKLRQAADLLEEVSKNNNPMVEDIESYIDLIEHQCCDRCDGNGNYASGGYGLPIIKCQKCNGTGYKKK